MAALPNTNKYEILLSVLLFINMSILTDVSAFFKLKKKRCTDLTQFVQMAPLLTLQ